VLFPLTTITVPLKELLPGRMCERNVPDVSPERQSSPVAPEHPAAEGIDFNVSNALPSGPLEAKGKPTHAAEDIKEPGLRHYVAQG
jgi:hypothetical protein